MRHVWLLLFTTWSFCFWHHVYSTNPTRAFESQSFKKQAGEQSILSFEDLLWRSRLPRVPTSGHNKLQANETLAANAEEGGLFQVQVTAIHLERAEFPLNNLLFRLTLRLAMDALKKRLEQRRIRLLLSIRSANTCSRQFAAAVAAEEYYKSRARLFIVSGCDDAIRGVSRLASQWRVPVMTAAGFGADLSNKRIHKTLIRVAFSLKSAVDFLMKILKSYQWRRINLIVDESDPNSLALRKSIEEHLAAVATYDATVVASGGGYNSSTPESFQVKLNAILLDLHSLTNMNSSDEAASTTSGDKTDGYKRKVLDQADKWPNEAADLAVRDALKQSSLFSRVNILLIPQSYLRKFMLTVYDQNMANGFYTFINMPLLQMAEEEQQQQAIAQPASGVSNSSTTKQSSYITSTGENVFVWRSPKSPRNSEAKQAYESLMSIYLRTPTAKAYVYFQSRLLNLANTNYATTTEASVLASSKGIGSQNTKGLKIHLSINPYTASFYDCLEIYAHGLEESLDKLQKSSHLGQVTPNDLHASISDLVKKRRFDNMVTGTIQLNENGDRETDFTLNDLNQVTGKYNPVILYRGDKHDIERLSRIQWSSDDTVGPTVDNVDCRLTNTCASKPWSKFLITLMLLGTPLAFFMGLLLYCIYKSISLESQLVDYWWKIGIKDIEFVNTRRKVGGESVSDGGMIAGSQVESSHDQSQLMLTSNQKQGDSSSVPVIKVAKSGFTSELDKTVVTRVTGTSAGFNSTALDICYGEISLGIYKLNKVAVKPIAKFHQSRKLMIELRTMKSIEHNNLCRFIGIVVDEGCQALVIEFCPKGSLREFFQNESMVIDWTFKYSIINDITAGLNYLQSSDLEFHGRLKSSNCLVSSRFVVKLSDYGLETLHEYLDNDEDETLMMKKQIWRAPEHMKSGISKKGSKKGDIYSFGLLLYEIATNNLPFYDMKLDDYVMPLKSLYNELKTHGPTAKTGPNTSTIETQTPEGKDIKSLVELMQRCWAFDPNKRPSLLVVSAALKRITHGITSKKLLENLTSRMEQYTNNLESLVDAKLAALLEEKQKTEELLYQFVPRTIASRLKEGETVEPEAFDCVTVLFSDIVGFTSLSSESTPIEVIDFLSDLYLCFDETLQQYDIFKVDTIGDAYIVASGLPQRNEGKHVLEIAQTALELRDRLANFKIPHKPGRSLEMRVGINSGPCIAGIVGGLKMPKYCVFGDTLTTGKFMESSGQAMKIHITDESKKLLERIGGFKIEPRAPRITKDGLPFQTYWLERL